MGARRAVPLLAAFLLGVGVQVAGAAPDCVADWETSGAIVAGAMDPQGLAVDGQGNLYVTDMAGHRLVKFRCDGIALACWGGPGAGPGEFRGPSAVAVNEAAEVFVADCYNHRVQKFTRDGSFLREWGSRGTGPGEFDHPSGIAVDGNGRVYVADTGNGRVQIFTGEGLLLDAWSTGAAETGRGGGGGRGDDVTQPPDGDARGMGLKGVGIEVLVGPRAVSVGPDGMVYLLEGTGVRKFTADGRFLAGWGDPGSGPGELAAAAGLIVGPGEMVYVADAGGARVRIYTATGHFIDDWSSVSRTGRGSGGRPGDDYEQPPDVPGVTGTAGSAEALALPRAVAGDGRGHLYVTDAGHDAVFEFAYPSMPRRAACDLDPRTIGCGVVITSGEPVTLAVLGAPEYPSCDIAFESLRLCGGGAPSGCDLRDVCATLAGDAYGSLPGPDGCPDLLLCFCPEQVLDAAGLDGWSTEGEATLIGAARDGTPFWGAAPVVEARGGRGLPGPRPPEHFRRLEFTVPVESQVTIRVFDVAGRLVRTLEDGFRSAGDHAVDWNPGGLPSGVYFTRIQSADQVECRKVVILP